MSTPVKVVLGILAGLLVLCLGSGAAGYFWFNSNKDRLRAEGDRARDEGRAAGQGRTPEECVELGFARFDASPGLVGEATARLYLSSCLRAAGADAAFCAGVPKRDELVKTAAWAVTVCAERGRPDDQPCTRFVQGLQEACSGTGSRR